MLARDVRGTTVLVAASLDDVADGTAALGGALVVAVPLTAAVLAGIVWWAVGRALRPVEDIRTRVDSITAANLDARVPEPDTAEEISRLSRTMNAMLGRLQDSADRQRRFVADASHELRSPLARMRTELEVDRAHPGSADLAATSRSVLDEVVSLQQLVEDLLVLARGDADAVDLHHPVPVDLDEVVGRLATRVRATGVAVDTREVRPVQVPGDPAALERAVWNLLDNAARHARCRVTLTVEESGGGMARAIVTDDGPGIAAVDRERVFERFTRLDGARSAGDGGAGLGLAIARDIARRHGGDLGLGSGGTAGACFVLTLPAAGRSDESAAQRRGRGSGTRRSITQQSRGAGMASVQQAIDVDVPIRVAYDQWTQFESFPQFMGGVERITQLDDTRTHWVTKIGGVEREFDAEITEQHPEERIAWTSTTGDSKHAGVVTFHRLDDNKTRVMIQIDWEPEGVVEKVGAAVGVDDHQVKADAKRFKEFIESRGTETGAWRGDVPRPDQQ